MVQRYLITLFCFSLFYTSNTLPANSTPPSQNVIYKVSSAIKEKILAAAEFFKSFTKNFNLWLSNSLIELEYNESFIWKLLFAFLAGLSVSLTPCIYPLIPITIGILSSGRKLKRRVQIIRSISYLLGISTVFSTLGFIAIKFNLMFGSWLANPWVIGFVVSFFVFLSLTMLEVINFDIIPFEIKAPTVSSVFSAFLYGNVTGLIASPCMTPALLTLLGFVSQESNSFLGAMILFSFALGMSFLIIIFSSFSGLLLLMPRPGKWMLEFRHALGFGILFLSINFLTPLIYVWQVLFLKASLWAIIAFFYYFNSRKEAINRMIVAHRRRVENTIEEANDIGFFEHMSPWMIVKKIFAVIAFLIALYFFSKAYLTFNKVRLLTILKKLILK